MFRCASRRLAIGAYSLFMIEQKNHPKLQGLAVSDRGRLTSKLYKALSPSERAQLQKRAAVYVSHKRQAKAKTVSGVPKKPAGTRKPSPYATFVKENIHKFDKLPHHDRMKAVAKLWKQQQQRVGH